MTYYVMGNDELNKKIKKFEKCIKDPVLLNIFETLCEDIHHEGYEIGYAEGREWDNE